MQYNVLTYHIQQYITRIIGENNISNRDYLNTYKIFCLTTIQLNNIINLNVPISTEIS